jgi:hypothetical protein
MDWKSRVRSAFATPGSLPADDVLEELAEHASALYEAAIADESACSRTPWPSGRASWLCTK